MDKTQYRQIRNLFRGDSEGANGSSLLYADRVGDNETRLLHFDHTTDNRGVATCKDDFPVEFIVLTGRLYDNASSSWLEAGDYVVFEANQQRGPFSCNDHCVALELHHRALKPQLSMHRQSERHLLKLERRIGIGGGSHVGYSGEEVVFHVVNALKVDNAAPLVVFDVGANQGQYATSLYQYLDHADACHLHCFEPSAHTFSILHKRFSNQSNVVLNQLGLGKSKANAKLYMDAQGSGLASMTQRDIGHLSIQHGMLNEEIAVDTLDNYCREHNIVHIDFLKIDVEGHELDVLAGAKEMFRNQGVDQGIDMVQFEFGGCNIDTRTFFRDFFFLFKSCDFDLFRIVPGGKLFKLHKYQAFHEKFRTANFFAARKSLEIGKKFNHLMV